MAETSPEGSSAADRKPAEKPHEPAVRIFHEWCKGCGICVAFCPKQVLEMDRDQKAHVAHEENCIRCFLCARRCPDLAITVVESEDDVRDDDPDSGVDLEEEGDDR